MKRIVLLSVLLFSGNMQCAEKSDQAIEKADKTGELCIEMDDIQRKFDPPQTIPKKKKRCTPACRKTALKGAGFGWRAAAYCLLAVGAGSGLATIGESIHIQTSMDMGRNDTFVNNPYCHYEYKPNFKKPEFQEPSFCKNMSCPDYNHYINYSEPDYTPPNISNERLVRVCKYPITYYSPSVTSGVATDPQITPAAITTGVCLAVIVGQAIIDGLTALEHY